MSTKTPAPLRPDPVTGFAARCNLSRPHLVSALPHYLRREYEEKGWRTATRTVRVKGRHRHGLCFLEPLCEGAEFTDRAEFERHMREEHAKKTVYGEHENWSKSIRRGWPKTKAKPEGAPLKPSTKEIAARLVKCDGCGLVMENDGRESSRQYVREHLELCVSRAGAA